MIRTRMGTAATTAAAYKFDPATGLSKDPALPPYMQDLTAAQLQTALSGGDPGPELQSLLLQDQTGSGAGNLPCGNSLDPNCTGGTRAGAIPTWAYFAGAGALLVLLVRR